MYNPKPNLYCEGKKSDHVLNPIINNIVFTYDRCHISICHRHLTTNTGDMS